MIRALSMNRNPHRLNSIPTPCINHPLKGLTQEEKKKNIFSSEYTTL